VALWEVAFRPIGWVTSRVFLLRQRLREVWTATGLIADELDYNAHILGRYQDGTAVQELQAGLKFDAYNEHAEAAYAMARRHPDLWAEVTQAYGALKRTAATGSFPPFGSDHLLTLAEELRENRY
jgi:hypothetical protein